MLCQSKWLSAPGILGSNMPVRDVKREQEIQDKNPWFPPVEVSNTKCLWQEHLDRVRDAQGGIFGESVQSQDWIILVDPSQLRIFWGSVILRRNRRPEAHEKGQLLPQRRQDRVDGRSSWQTCTWRSMGAGASLVTSAWYCYICLCRTYKRPQYVFWISSFWHLTWTFDAKTWKAAASLLKSSGLTVLQFKPYTEHALLLLLCK